MNLILTSICNKNCSFCFAKNKGTAEEMPLEEILSNIKKNQSNGSVKLLGGEPTLYSKFPELFEALEGDEYEGIVLVSNFLIKKQSVKDALLKYQKKKPLFCLLNVSEMTDAQNILVKNNIKELITNEDSGITLGFTFDKEKTIEDYKPIFENFLSDESILKRINSIRVSVPFPNYKKGDDKEFYLYQEYRYTDLLVDFIKLADNYHLEVSIDCGLFPCMMRDKEMKDFIGKKLSNSTSNINGCEGIALDIYPGGKAIACYPANFITANANEHETTNTLNEELLQQKKFYNAIKLPKECVGCNYLESGECSGPCNGFSSNF